jgi:hypothetical protein
LPKVLSGRSQVQILPGALCDGCQRPSSKIQTAGGLEAVVADQPAVGLASTYLSSTWASSPCPELVLPVVLLVVGLEQRRCGRTGRGDGAFDDDDIGAAVQEDGDSRFFRMARRMVELPILDCNRC